MTRVLVWVEISDDDLVAFEHEAEREGRTTTSLVEQTVQVLWNEMKREERMGGDHTIEA